MGYFLPVLINNFAKNSYAQRNSIYYNRSGGGCRINC